MDYQSEYLKLNKNLHEEDRKSKVKAIIEILPKDIDIKSIVDVACGSGNILRDVADYTNSKNNIGIDISSEIIKKANNQDNKKFTWITSDIFDYNQTSFDLVLAIDIVEHVVEDEKLLNKLYDLGELIIVKVPIEDNLINRIVTKITNGKIDPLKDTENKYGHIHHYSLKNVNELISKTDLTVENINFMHLPKRSKTFWEIIRLLILPFWLISKKFYIMLNGGFVIILLKGKNL